MLTVQSIAYSTESQVSGSGIQESVVKSFFRYAAGLRVPEKVSDGVHSKQMFRLVRICQYCIL